MVYTYKVQVDGISSKVRKGYIGILIHVYYVLNLNDRLITQKYTAYNYMWFFNL